MKNSLAIYQTIALDIAKRIACGEIPVGTKLSGRSILSSQYGVSPETIRKAIGLLKDSDIVQVSQGKEVVIVSQEQGCHFVTHQKDIQSAYSLRQELELLLEKKNEIDKQFEDIVNKIMRFSDRLKNLKPFNPVELTVPGTSHLVGKALGQIDFWHHTQATVIAIRREVEVIVSPGPEARIQANDKLVVVGPDDSTPKVAGYINTAQGPQRTPYAKVKSSFVTLSAFSLFVLKSQSLFTDYDWGSSVKLALDLLA